MVNEKLTTMCFRSIPTHSRIWFVVSNNIRTVLVEIQTNTIEDDGRSLGGLYRGHTGRKETEVVDVTASITSTYTYLSVLYLVVF